MNHKTNNIYYLLFIEELCRALRMEKEATLGRLCQSVISYSGETARSHRSPCHACTLRMVSIVPRHPVSLHLLSRLLANLQHHTLHVLDSLLTVFPNHHHQLVQLTLQKSQAPGLPSYLVAGATKILSVGNTHPFGCPNQEHGFLFAHTQGQKEDLGARKLKLRSSS